jgi:acyl-CoA synthetase (AMP-forming)/AMP-acid ligase II
MTSWLSSSGFIPALIQSHSSKDQIRTVPELVEYNAERNADHHFCVQTRKNGNITSERLLYVTHQQLKHAILQCQAWLLHNVSGIQLPRRDDDGNIKKGATVALLMESDIGFWIHLLSLMGLGVPVS